MRRCTKWTALKLTNLGCLVVHFSQSKPQKIGTNWTIIFAPQNLTKKDFSEAKEYWYITTEFVFLQLISVEYLYSPVR